MNPGGVLQAAVHADPRNCPKTLVSFPALRYYAHDNRQDAIFDAETRSGRDPQRNA